MAAVRALRWLSKRRSSRVFYDRVSWCEIYVDTRTLDLHIGRLRKSLRQYGRSDVLCMVREASSTLG